MSFYNIVNSFIHKTSKPSQSSAEIFIDWFNSIRANKKCWVLGLDQPIADIKPIGFIDLGATGHLMIRPKNILPLFWRYCGEDMIPFWINSNFLARQLVKEGFLIPGEKGRNTHRLMRRGRRQYYWVFNLSRSIN